jgi:hypothetical protein
MPSAVLPPVGCSPGYSSAVPARLGSTHCDAPVSDHAGSCPSRVKLWILHPVQRPSVPRLMPVMLGANFSVG